MRKELEIIEKIEKYLKGQMSASEKADFENQLAADSKLREEVELQEEIMKGIERASLKQRAKKAYKKYKLTKNFIKWGLTGLSIIIVASAILYYSKHSEHSYSKNIPYELNELGKNEWADADKYLPIQNFNLNTTKDTVIETDAGIVMVIPANCFLDDDGKPVDGDIELEVKEALDAASIMKAGLSSKSGDRLLESGGMFYVNARKDGKPLKINPANGIYAEVPTDNKKADMQLFEGERKSDGTINWVNPKPLENYLTPVDIHSLDFYPPSYLDSLKKWGYDAKNKKFTDSLYYSFASLFVNDSDTTIVEEGLMMPNLMDMSLEGAKFMLEDYGLDIGAIIYGRGNVDMVYGQQIEPGSLVQPGTKVNLIVGSNSVNKHHDVVAGKFPYSNKQYYSHKNKLFDSDTLEVQGINPAKIKSIWNDKFKNTLISTREFEKRLPYIHRTCNNVILDLYINNLDKNISHIDSIAAYFSECFNEEFLYFASKNEGKVKINSSAMNKLRDYYKLKTKAITEATAKIEKNYLDKQIELEEAANNKQAQHQQEDLIRENKNLMKEYDINLTEAYRQLGIKKPQATVVSGEVYGVTIATTGWKNVDVYVMEATVSRTTLDYTSKDGKKAVIKYLPVSIQIKDYLNYDRLYVYLLPDKLNSFMRLKQNKDRFDEKLNELMSYKMVCLGYKGDDVYVFDFDKAQPKTYGIIALEQIDKKSLDQKLNTLKSMNQISDMKKELDYLKIEVIETKRKKAEYDRMLFRDMVMKVIFPCHNFPEDRTESRKVSYSK